MNRSRILKPIDKLRTADLERHWLWAFASDAEGLEGQDETSVEPLRVEAIPLNCDTVFAVADLLGPESRQFVGLVAISTIAGINITPGAIVTETAYGPLPDPSHWLADSVLEFTAAQLGLPRTAFFPLQYRLRPKFAGETSVRSGQFTFGESDA